MKLLNVIADIGKGLISTHPLGAAAITAVNAFLPADRQLTTNNTGDDVVNAIDSLPQSEQIKSVISQIHTIEKGDTVGYNRVFSAKEKTRTATIPIGHADGLSRKLGNKNYNILVNNQQAPIIGNVCIFFVSLKA